MTATDDQRAWSITHENIGKANVWRVQLANNKCQDEEGCVVFTGVQSQ